MPPANVEAGQRATAETGFMSVISLGGHDLHTTKPVPLILQVHWLERRFRLTPDMARYVAELAFDKRPSR
jgi:hypothetical protein